MHEVGQLLNFTGLYGEMMRSETPDFIHMESLSLRSRTYDWEITQHVHTALFQFFILTHGNGALTSEKNNVSLRSPCIVTVPTNTLHGFTFDPGMEGVVITLSDGYLEALLKDYPRVMHQINTLNVFALAPEDASMKELHYLIAKLSEELSESDVDRIALQPIIRLLMICIYRLNIEEQQDQIISSRPSLRIYNQFQKLIRKSLPETLSVRKYAAALGITTVHLNRVCQQISSKTALRTIHDRLIEESKRYLLNTEYSISEVAYFLNFQDPAHFTKLFKKYVGVTPREFRKN